MRLSRFFEFTESDKIRVSILKERRVFKTSVKEVQEKWQIFEWIFNNPQKHCNYCEKCRTCGEHLIHVIESKDFKKDIYVILKDCNLNAGYFNLVSSIVLENRVSANDKINYAGVYMETDIDDVDKITNLPAFYLRFYPETSTRELLQSFSKAKKVISKKYKNKTTKKGRWELFDDHKKLYIRTKQLEKEGKSRNSIVTILNNEGFKISDYNTLNVTINRYEKRLEK
jgi:hypothetical protein